MYSLQFKIAFPRPNGRGLIEAVLEHLVGQIPLPWFPRPNGRGLIEARASAAQARPPPRFPRPNGRGLIEACIARYFPPTLEARFRGPTAAASLKLALDRQLVGRHVERRFRGPTAAAAPRRKRDIGITVR